MTIDQFSATLRDSFLRAIKSRDLAEQNVRTTYNIGHGPYRTSANVFDVLQDAMMANAEFGKLVKRHAESASLTTFKAYELAGADWYVSRYAEELFAIDAEARRTADMLIDAEAQAEFLADCRRSGHI